MFYAEIDENNKVVGISCLSGVVDNPLYIEIDSYNASIMGYVYNPDDGTFTPPEPEPQPTPTPSITMEQINENQLAIMEALTDLYMTVSETGVE